MSRSSLFSVSDSDLEDMLVGMSYTCGAGRSLTQGNFRDRKPFGSSTNIRLVGASHFFQPTYHQWRWHHDH